MPSQTESTKEIRLSFTEQDLQKLQVLKAKLGKKSYVDLINHMADEYITDSGLLDKPMFAKVDNKIIATNEDE